MQVIYVHDPIPQNVPSIFLVGPTPRKQADGIKCPSWRPEALEILTRIGFEGCVIVPEGASKELKRDYVDQANWERAGLEACTVIAAWVPREMNLMPALTTNVEFGRYVTSGRLWYGRPNWAAHTRYLDWLYRLETNREPFDNLEGLLTECCTHLAQIDTCDRL